MLSAREIRTIAEDLLYVRAAWRQDPSDSELRRGSAILRRLLVEENLEHCWRALKLSGQFRIAAPDIDSIYEKIRNEDVPLLLALGAHYKGVELRTFILKGLPTDGAVLEPPRTEADIGNMKIYYWRNYLNSASGIRQETDQLGKVTTSIITRSDVIKYVAHNLGGVHLGESKRKSGQRIAARVRKFEGVMRLLDKDLLFYEILAIGQCLTNSPDIPVLLERAG